MYYGHTLSLGRNFMGSRGDADAASYVAAVVAAGGTVSGAQATAINDFYVSAKADSYYTSLKRLYLPIWGVAAANAIDMITLAAGTFNGTVTHAAGYVQGDGSTGYFDFGVSPSAIGITNSSGAIGSLIYVADTRTDFRFFMGARVGGASGEVSLYRNVANNNSGFIGRLPTTPNASITSASNGILVQNRTTGSSLICYRRSSSGLANGATQTATPTDAITTSRMFSLALSESNLISAPSDAKFGSYFALSGLSTGDVSGFTLALKTMWETCTQLTLP